MDLDEDELIFTRFDIPADKELYLIDDFSLVPSNIHLSYFDDGLIEREALHLCTRTVLISFSLLISSLGILPLSVYFGFLPDLEWNIFCVLRTIVFGVIFSSLWYLELSKLAKSFCFDDYYKRTNRYIVKTLLFVFTILYAGLYTIKWYILDNIPVRYIALTAFFLSFSLTFFHLSIDSISADLNTTTSRTHRRIARKALTLTLRYCWKDFTLASMIADNLNKNSVSPSTCLYLLHKQRIFFSNITRSLVDLYEDSICDVISSKIRSLGNIFLGIISMILFATLLEDYGYALAKITSLENDEYFWLLGIICLVLTGFYIFCSYKLYHKTLINIFRFITLRDSFSIFKEFLMRLPSYLFGAIIASLRVNSSYSILGKVIAKLHLPYSLGLTVIYLCVSMVFFLDLITSSRLAYKAISFTITSFFSWFYQFNLFNSFCSYFQVKFYIDKYKERVKNAEADELENLIRRVMCRI